MKTCAVRNAWNFDLLAALTLCVLAASGRWTGSTSCGGNSAALAGASYYAIGAWAEAMDSPEHVFNVRTATPQQREWLRVVPGVSWIRSSGRFLVSTLPAVANPADPRRIVIVCDRAYPSVPQHWYRSARPSHAAGFADGSAALISPAQFAALDRSSFVPLEELLRPIAGAAKE